MRVTTEDGKIADLINGQLVYLTDQQILEEKGIVKKKEIKAQVIKEEKIVLEDKQKEALDLCMDDNSLIISGLAGSGKLQPYYSKIITPTGIKTMGEIKKGDFVIGKNGKPIEVLETYPQKDLEIYRVTFKNGDTVDCCKDHIWTIQTAKLKANNKYRNETTLDLLKQSLHKTAKSGYRFRVPSINAVEFEPKTLKIHPYLMGYLLGDGYIPEKGNITIACSSEDFKEVYEKLKKFSQYKLTAQKRQVNVERINISTVSGIREDLKDLELLGHKSRTKFIPDIYMYNSVENRKFILAGLLDTNSHCQRFESGKVKIRYSTSSESLSNQVKELVLSLGGIASITKIFRKGTYEYNVPIRLPFNPYLRNYKKEIYGDYKNTEDFSRQITNIEYIGVHDGQCLLVNSDDHLYLTDNYIPTHNSTVIKEVIKELKKKRKNVAVLSTTGISATLLDSGSTFHSFFSIMPQKVLTEKNIVTVKPNKAKMWQAISHVIVDEMSMLRADTFDLAILNLIHNGCDYTKIKWIFLGDFLQLQCILQKDEKPHFHYEGLDFRYSNHFKNLNVKEIELTQVRRQSDNEFISALNKIRVGEYTDYFKQFENIPEKEDAIYIAATNKLVDARNKAKLDEIDSDLIVFEGQVSPKFNPKDFQVSKTIEVKDGCKIMYLINDKNVGLCNGDKGILKIVIKDNKVIPYFVSDRLNITVALNPHVFETKEYKLIGKAIELVTKDFIEQYPIKLAYAISIHRSQGSTFDSIILDKQDRFFAPQMEYVGLSRCRYKEGLCIITKK